jgi:hypothetical protein
MIPDAVTAEDVLEAGRLYQDIEADPGSGTHAKAAYWANYERTLRQYKQGIPKGTEPTC